MKRIFFTIAFVVTVFSFIATVTAQNQWIRQAPVPDFGLSGVEWISPAHGFVAGRGASIYETTDGGASWRRIQLTDVFPASRPIHEIYFRDANNGFAFGDSGTTSPDVYRTTDGGATWAQVTAFPPGGSWTAMDFVSPGNGFMIANGAIVGTTDGGAIWTYRAQLPSSPIFFGFDFRDENVGLAGGLKLSASGDGGAGIFKTTDGGVTWTRKFPNAASDLLWLSAATAVASVENKIYRSSDAGESWTEISNQTTTGLSDMTLLPNGNILGVSGFGDVWRSTDGGVNWTRTLTGLGTFPASWSIDFFDDVNGAVAGQGFAYRTTDGGATWTMLNSGLAGFELNELEMFDDNTGIAVGDNGHLLRTVNGGNFWQTTKIRDGNGVFLHGANLQAISVVDVNFAVIAGSGGFVFKTFDKGLTWQSIGQPLLSSEYEIEDVHFINRNVGYLAGLHSGSTRNLYRTVNGGASWEAVQVNGGNSVDFIDVSRGWVVNPGGLGHRTTDGGATWQPFTIPDNGGSVIINKIDFINENEGWAVGWYGYAAHTIDGGRTWQVQNVTTQQETILDARVVSPTEVFAVGVDTGTSGDSFLYHTNDAGQTWRKQLIPSEYSMDSIFVGNAGKIWSPGFDGAIFHQTNFTAPAPALILTFNPTRIIGGNPVQGTVKIAAPAPSGGTVVNLSSDNPSLVGLPASVTIPAGATEVSFEVTTQVVSPNVPSPRITVTASANGNVDTAVLVLAAATECSFAITPSREDFGASGGIVIVNVTAPAGCTWTAASNRNWVTFEGATSGTGNGSVTIRIAQNSVTLTRFTTITIATKPFAIFQFPANDCEYSLASNGQAYGLNGGDGQVGLNTANGCAWATHSNANWISLNTSGGQGSGNISYTVLPNNTSQNRSGTFTVSGRVFTIVQNKTTGKFDYDGDGKADISVFRPSAGSWYRLNSSNGAFIGVQFGTSGDLIAPADFDGDGKTDISVFRPADGGWYRLNSSNNTFAAAQFGTSGDLPVPGDFDGDGRADIAVFRPSAAGWYRVNSSNNQFIANQFGASGDKPIVGDFDGDGKTDLAVFRPTDGGWYRISSSNGSFSATQFGAAEDLPVAADFDGDGKTDLAVYRPAAGSWYLINSANGAFAAAQFGAAEDKPAPADFDGDGKSDLAVFRPSTGSWYLLRSSAGFTGVQFGAAGDIPTPNAFVR